MASAMRMIAPPRKIQKDAQSYSSLVFKVFNSRTLYGLRFLFIINFIASFVLLYAGSGLRVLAINALGQLLLQLVLRSKNHKVYDPVSPTLLIELWRKFVSRELLKAVTVFLSSTVLFFYTFWVRPFGLSFLKTESLDSPVPARGLPKNAFKATPGQISYIDERFNYSLSFGFTLAVIYAFVHIALGRNLIPLTKAKLNIPPQQRITASLAVALLRAVLLTVVLTMVWPLVYWGLVSHFRFGYYYKKFLGYNIVGFTGFPTFYFISFETFRRWLALVFMWESSFVVIAIYQSLGPVYKKSLISGLSSDPNGSLISGMQGRPYSLSQALAWAELLIISQSYVNRRASIYNDSSAEKSVWKQVFAEYCSLVSHMNNAIGPRATPEAIKGAAAPQASTTQKLLSAEVVNVGSDQSIFVSSGRESRLYKLAERTGPKKNPDNSQSPGSITSAIRDTETRVTQGWKSIWTAFLGSKFGIPARATTSRAIGILLGDTLPLEFGLPAIAGLIARSLDEDEIGYVQSDIALCLSELDVLITRLDTLVRNPPVEPSNVPVFNGELAPDVSQAERIRDSAVSAFVEISEAFRPYFDNLGVSAAVRERSRTLQNAVLS